jgi:RNA polymerase-binding transcription factor DksA
MGGGARIRSGVVSEVEHAEAATVQRIPVTQLDVEGIERDLADVEVALERLDAGTYWTDEVTGAPLDDELLAVRPTARRAEPS